MVPRNYSWGYLVRHKHEGVCVEGRGNVGKGGNQLFCLTAPSSGLHPMKLDNGGEPETNYRCRCISMALLRAAVMREFHRRKVGPLQAGRGTNTPVAYHITSIWIKYVVRCVRGDLFRPVKTVHHSSHVLERYLLQQQQSVELLLLRLTQDVALPCAKDNA